jgi:uncharacterized protein YggE
MHHRLKYIIPKKEFAMKTKITFLLISLVGIIALAACSATSGGTPSVNNMPTRTVNVNGFGQVYVTPDVAYVNIGVQNQGDSVTTVLDDNTAQAQGIRTALAALGVADQDIQTSGFNVYPNNTFDQNGQITGTYYVANNTVYVTVRDLSKLGKILDATVKSGANTINSITFSVLDQSKALEQARQLAVEDAQGQAQQLVDLTGAKLGPVQYISISSSQVPIPIYEGKGGGGYSAANTSSVPVSSGQMTISVNVNITYEIK